MLRALKETRFIKTLISLKNKTFVIMSTEVETLLKSGIDLCSKKRAALREDIDNEILVKQQKVEDLTKLKKRNHVIMLSYLGKDYYGMQRNPDIRTIEEDLINALFKADLIKQDAFETIQLINFQRAARTDKGVSATRQIVSLKIPEDANKDMINEHLPNVIRVMGLKRVTKGFNSKNQCDARSYTYTLPTFAFAPDDPTSLRPKNAQTDDINLDERVNTLSVIDGKPFTEFRLSPEIRTRIDEVLKLFEGTHNFHNFTSKIKPLDPRASRYIINFTSSEPYVSQGMEFMTLHVKGQSFLLHQIRKMVSLAIGVVRNLVNEETFHDAFKHEKMDIPIAPSLGLVLHYVHYDKYNKRYGKDGMHESLVWEDCEKDVMKFHKEFILRHIEDTEIKEKSMLLWLASLALHTYGARNRHVGESDKS